MSIKIKICCISSKEESDLAIRCGADILGLVGPMPSGPGPIEISLIKEIADHVPGDILTFLLTCVTSAEEIIEIQKKTNTKVLQLVDAVDNLEVYSTLREQIPQIKIVQVIHVTGPGSIEEALLVAPHVHGLLLDSGNPKLAVKELGGTGRVHDWEISRTIVKQAGVPVFLAGGLNPQNVYDAIDHVQPYGVDVCSGLRKNGRLDEDLLKDFIFKARNSVPDNSSSPELF